MKKLFYTALAGLVVFEVLKVYFIMPMPGSQRVESLPAAYLLHGYRWVFRIALLLVIAGASRRAFRIRHKWLPAVVVLVAVGVVWVLNFQMTAESIFKQPQQAVFKSRADSSVDERSLVIGVEHNGEAKAYPIRFLVYHHQVQDSVGGTPFLIRYCSVCRSGRVYAPLVNGHLETFRLVGMDHFNAMFEDTTTHSWWRQATGEAVAGPLTGSRLPEEESSQVTLRQWFEWHPGASVMQPDAASTESYDPNARYERGESLGALTRTDPASWQDKSWVVGVQVGSVSKAYDWNRLKGQRVINDTVGATPIVLVLSSDDQSFAVFERPVGVDAFDFHDNVLSASGRSFDLSGRDLATPGQRLTRIKAYQEFWHSWRSFHPGTLRD